MTSAEKKELAIWGGGAAAALILGWIAISMLSGDELAGKARNLHGQYTKLYLTKDVSSLPAAEAEQQVAQLLQKQRDELARAEGSVVFPGEDSDGVPVEFRSASGRSSEGFDFAQDLDSASAVAKILGVNDRLNAQLRSRGIAWDGKLPFETKEGMNLDVPGVAALQIAQVCCYAMVVELCMEIGISRLHEVSVNRLDCRRDPSGNYAAIPTKVTLTTSPTGADQLIRRLAAHHSGLALQSVVVDQLEDENRQTVTVVAELLVRCRKDWGDIKVRELRGAGTVPAGGVSPVQDKTAPAAPTTTPSPGRRTRRGN